MEWDFCSVKYDVLHNLKARSAIVIIPASKVFTLSFSRDINTATVDTIGVVPEAYIFKKLDEGLLIWKTIHHVNQSILLLDLRGLYGV